MFCKRKCFAVWSAGLPVANELNYLPSAEFTLKREPTMLLTFLRALQPLKVTCKLLLNMARSSHTHRQTDKLTPEKWKTTTRCQPGVFRMSDLVQSCLLPFFGVDCRPYRGFLSCGVGVNPLNILHRVRSLLSCSLGGLWVIHPFRIASHFRLGSSNRAMNYGRNVCWPFVSAVCRLKILIKFVEY